MQSRLSIVLRGASSLSPSRARPPREILVSPSVSLTTMTTTARRVPKHLNSLSAEERKAFVDSINTVLTDCDGAIWLGGKALPGAPEVMNTLSDLGKKTYFVTNNSTQTREEFVKKCNRLGFKATTEQMIGTAYLTAQFLKSINFSKRAYIMGSKAIQTELSYVGIEGFGVGPDLVSPDILSEGDGQNKIEQDVGAVIVGYDVHFGLPKMIKACTYLKNRDVLFIGTNPDEQFPRDTIFVWPGTGAMVKAIETGAQRHPVIMGKPAPFIIEGFLKPQGLDTSKALMIGDRCNTDIVFGNEANMKTLLVLTGVTTKEHLDDHIAENRHHMLPTYYADSIQDLLPLLK